MIRSEADSSLGRPALSPFARPTKCMGWEPMASFPAILIFPLLLFLSGCMVGPNYKRPNVTAPVAFRGASGAAQQSSFADLPWWEVFRDETLKELIKTSLANNYDLAVAVARVEQARQIAAEARSQYFPAIGYASIISYGHNQFVGSPASPSPTLKDSFSP